MAVATALTVASIAAQAAGTIASFSSARKASRDLVDAEQAAEEFVKEAEKRLEINEMERLAIAKEPYELQRQALLSQGTQAIEAGRESERGAAATAGRIFAGQASAQRQTRADMAGRVEQIKSLVAGEASRLRDVGMGINLEQAAGAQEAAAQAEERRAQAIQQGIQGLGDIALSTAQMQPLYAAQGKQARQLRRGIRKGTLNAGNLSSEQQLYLQSLGFGDGNYGDAGQYLFQSFQTPQGSAEQAQQLGSSIQRGAPNPRRMTPQQLRYLESIDFGFGDEAQYLFQPFQVPQNNEQ